MKWAPLDWIEAAIPTMRRRRVSEVARGRGGFLSSYRAVGGDRTRMSRAWAERREDFLARHLAQAEARDEALWETIDGEVEPTRRHLALLAWAYTPDPKRMLAWLKREHSDHVIELILGENAGEVVVEPDLWPVNTDMLSGRLASEYLLRTGRPATFNVQARGRQLHVRRILANYSDDPRALPPTQRPDRHAHPKDPIERYIAAHGGHEPDAVYEWDGAPPGTKLVGMGQLVELVWELPNGEAVFSRFAKRTARPGDILCFSSDNRERIYFALSPATMNVTRKLWRPSGKTYDLNEIAQQVGGRQANWTDPPCRVQVLGVCSHVTYHTEKWDDGPSDYEHEMGEWGGTPPMLCVERTGQLWFAGGSYTVHNDGITR